MPLIRKFSSPDIDAVTAIYAHAVLYGAGTYEIEPPSRDEMKTRFERIEKQGFPILIAEENGIVLGYAYASHFRNRAAYNWLAEDSIYVSPDAKGKGVGKSLLKELVLRTEALGFRQMLAVIGDGDGNIGSVKLHESLGFTHCGSIRASGYKHGRWLNTILMQLPLNGGDADAPQASPLLSPL